MKCFVHFRTNKKRPKWRTFAAGNRNEMEKERKPQNSKAFILVFLGLLSAFGPFVMDMYLPTLPAMPAFFHTTPSMAQLSLTAGMIGLAAGQLVFGPLSDRFGRRPVLLAALALFLLSTAGCIFAGSIHLFIAGRLMQGIAGSGGVVLSRSIAADHYSGRELAGVTAVVGAVNGIATVAAPVAGGVLAGDSGWQGIFWFLFGIGILLSAGSLRLKESLPAASRTACGPKEMARHFKAVWDNPHYKGYVLQYGFTMGVLFTYIASAPHVMQQHYGLSPMSFSLCFGINAMAMAIASTMAGRFSSLEKALHAGSHGMVPASLLLAATLYGGGGFYLYEASAILLLSATGITFTASNALAMDSERGNAGTASALLGATGFAAGGIVSPLVSLGDILSSTSLLLLGGSLLACLCRHPLPLRSLLYGAWKAGYTFPFRQKDNRPEQ